MEGMTSIIFEKDRLLSRICKLSPKPGDVILFQLKTNEDGEPILSPSDIVPFVNGLKELSEELQCSFVLTLDKMGFFTTKNTEGAIKYLEQALSSIKKANRNVLDIENEK